MPKNQISYVELPTTDFRASVHFYRDLFGWTFEELGEDYAVFENAGIEGGLNPNQNDRTKSPLVIIETDEIETMQERVITAGCQITMPLFSYPGGRRFHFLDPSGNEMSVFERAGGGDPL